MAEPTSSRRYATTLVTGLLASTAVVVGVSRPWVRGTARLDGLPEIAGSVDGADAAPLTAALGFVLLASFGAVVATRGRVRRAVGVLITVLAVAVIVSALVPPDATDALKDDLGAHGWAGGDYTAHVVWWRWLVVTAAALCAAAGAAVVRYGGSWATMGAKYDAPAPGRPDHQAAAELTSETDVWRAIDRGDDPTQHP